MNIPSNSRFAAALPPPNADAAFFGGLSDVTSATYTGLTPPSTLLVALAVAGDASGDGCVAVQDYDLVQAQFGGSGSADFNHDGVVDIFDQSTVPQDLGNGCAASAPQSAVSTSFVPLMPGSGLGPRTVPASASFLQHVQS